MNIGKGLRIARAISGLKQGDVASEMGVSQNYLSLLENGHCKPSLDTLEAFAKYYDTKVSILLCEDG
jgi:transcriptional regulator with XRE-family HTH domain